MRKVKIFSDNGAELIQRIINDWLAKHENISVTDVLQSESCGYSHTGDRLWNLTVTIFYIEG